MKRPYGIIRLTLLALFTSSAALSQTQGDAPNSFLLDFQSSSWSYHHTYDTTNAVDSTHVTGSVRYTFTLARPAIVVVNHAGSELKNTMLRLIGAEMIGLFQNNRLNILSTDNSTIPSTHYLWSKVEEHLPDPVFAQNMREIGRNQGFICTQLCAGNYNLSCSGTEAVNGSITTHLYVYYLAETIDRALDISIQDTTFRQTQVFYNKEAGQNDVTFYRKMEFTSPMTFNAYNRGARAAAVRSKLLLYDSRGACIDSSDNYLTPQDSLPKIKDLFLPVGTYYVAVNIHPLKGRFESVVSGSVIRIEGDNMKTAFDLGEVATSNMAIFRDYDLSGFNDCYSPNKGKDVFLKINFKNPTDLTLGANSLPANTAFVYTLLSSEGAKIKDATIAALSNTLSINDLPPGNYYIVLESSSGEGKVNIRIRATQKVMETDPDWMPTQQQNYVITKIPLVALPNANYVTTKNARTTVNYYDKLGRPWQTVVYAGSPDGNDLVTLNEYDFQGMIAKTWLPVTRTKTGQFVEPEEVYAKAQSTYNDSRAYHATEYETTTLKRPVAHRGAGISWYNADRAVRTAYKVDVSGSYPYYEVGGTRENPSLKRLGYYKPGELLCKSIQDEDLNYHNEYSNRFGQKLFITSGEGEKREITQFVYDDYGNLCYVITPVAYDLLLKGTLGRRELEAVPDSLALIKRPADPFLTKDPDLARPDFPNRDLKIHLFDLEDALDMYCYRYKYDNRNRCIAKKLPGSEWVHYLFDDADQLVFSQNGEERKRNEWLCTIADRFGRPAITAVYKGTPDADKLSKSRIYASFAGAGALVWGYDVNDIDVRQMEVQQVKYYDNYLHRSLADFQVDPTAYEYDDDFSVRYGDDRNLLSSKGLVTGQIEKVLGTNILLFENTYYDYRKRPVQINSTTRDSGKVVHKIKYDFVGQPLKTLLVSRPTPESHADSLLVENRYDNMGRITTATTTLNRGTPVVETKHYNPVGRLASREIGTERFNYSTAYEYNIRGWLKRQSNDFFSMELCYNDPICQPRSPLYSGNISEWHWEGKVSGNPIDFAYTFKYDHSSRLVETRRYLRNMLRNQYYERGMTYDKNGNLLTLQRVLASLGENLAYEYDGNRLKKLTNGDSLYTYAYDAVGNMIHDGAENLDISYNNRNLVCDVSKEGTSLASYFYSAGGTKLGVAFGDGRGYEYIGSLIYARSGNDLTLESAGFDGGRFIAASGTEGRSHSPRYHIADHLGSVRVVLDSEGAEQERNDYFAFGKRIEYLDYPVSDNRFHYNGKEDQSFASVPFIDYGARMYNPSIGRWFNVDPLAETYSNISPYAFCANNPVKFTDPDGMYIRGVRKKDIYEFQADLFQIFADSKFSQFQKLLKIDKRQLMEISAQDLNEALKDADLDEDEKALVEIVTNTINSDDKHTIEYVDNNDVLSTTGANVIMDNDPYGGMINYEKTAERYGGIPASIVANRGGTGITAPTSKGTHSIVIRNPQQEITAGHEVFGHGRSLAIGHTDPKQQHVDAIQTENLIYRVMKTNKVNNGQNHYDGTVIPNPSELPSFR